jgi:nitronate monooxygenase
MLLASCRAGVVGSIPALNARTDEIFEAQLIEIEKGLKESRDKGEKCATYAVNLVLRNNDRLKVQMELVKKYKVGRDIIRRVG